MDRPDGLKDAVRFQRLPDGFWTSKLLVDRDALHLLAIIYKPTRDADEVLAQIDGKATVEFVAMPYPRVVREAVARPRRDDPMVSRERRISDAWFSVARAEKEAVDRWLVATGHPLAYEPGTDEYRFKALVREILEEEGCT